MEVHSIRRSRIAKKLWGFVRLAFFMMRKGLISKKKLLMDINLFFKRGRLIRKTVSNLLSHHHHHHHHQMTRGSFGLREYEFSCSNSPNPVFFHVSSSNRKNNNHHHLHLPCMNPPLVLDELESQDHDDHDHDRITDNHAILLVPKTPEYTFNLCLSGYDLAPGENRSPLRSPFPIKISDYSSEDDENDNGGNIQVDHEAEEFIKQFYEQLRAQSRIQLLQY